ncbi:MAG: tetratricopeptide repeat protein [Bacteroidetes bacterium]|nr:tetratricopeptide repeat protein [Bacteroidota bacterium]MBX7045600.1 tetratricopeptide repeat protein [Ignavibacteria bacterium]
MSDNPFAVISDYFNRNKNQVLIIGGAIIVIVIGIILFTSKRSAQNEDASVALTKIRPSYEAGNFQAAINGDSLGNKGLLFIVNEYGSSENGQLAKLMLANAYYGLRDFQNALKYYDDFGGSNKLSKVAAITGIASVKEAQNDYVGAAKEFERAANYDKDNPFRDEYLFYAGRDFAMGNDKASAKRVFDQLKNDFPKSKYIAQSQRYNYSID